MENSPAIQATLNEWLQLTIDHPLFVIALAIIVWILTAILYSFRMSSLSKQNTTIEKQRNSAETNLNNSQQQLQQLQIELSSTAEQLQQSVENEKQRALNAEQQLIQRNQQIAVFIQKLAKNVNFGETPIPFTADLKADELWQQHDKATEHLIETLRDQQLANNELQKFYQAEKDKVAIIEAHLQTLQANLDNQTKLIANLQNQNGALAQDLTVSTAVENKPVVDTSEKLKNLFKKPETKQEPIISQTISETVHETTVTDVLVTVTQPVTEPEPITEIIAKPEPEIISHISALKQEVNQGITNTVEVKTATKPAVEPIVKPPVIEQQTAVNKTQTAKPQPTRPVVQQNKPKAQYHASKTKLSNDVPSSRIEDMADNLTETVNKLKRLFSKSE